jgi:hypothetical protein
LTNQILSGTSKNNFDQSDIVWHHEKFFFDQSDIGANSLLGPHRNGKLTVELPAASTKLLGSIPT